ncbi:MAG: hypothetical protein JWQ42_2617 [Edaphobacter sp.]|jgi:hypothetical protein|nr:hypothetical protein [Edaphobacter sp.]
MTGRVVSCERVEQVNLTRPNPASSDWESSIRALQTESSPVHKGSLSELLVKLPISELCAKTGSFQIARYREQHGSLELYEAQ